MDQETKQRIESLQLSIAGLKDQMEQIQRTMLEVPQAQGSVVSGTPTSAGTIRTIIGGKSVTLITA